MSLFFGSSCQFLPHRLQRRGCSCRWVIGPEAAFFCNDRTEVIVFQDQVDGLGLYIERSRAGEIDPEAG